MKSFGLAILLGLLGPFCAAGLALGQASGPPSGVGAPITGNPLWAIPLDSLRETRDRPLFSVSRRPPPPVVAEAPKAIAPIAAAPPAAPEKPQVTLVGVVHGPGLDLAILVDEADKSLVRLRIGQSVGGWTVHGVDTRAATLEKAQQQVKLELPARNTETAARALTPADTVAAAAALDQ